MTDTSDKVRINPALVAALEHYASVLYDPKRPSIFVYEDKSGARHSWPIERACRVAAEVLADEELNLLKFKALKAGLAKAGMERLYEHIMGDKLSHPEPRRAGTMAPAALVAEVHMSRYTLEWLDGPLPEGTVLHKALP